jgi:hypothetical protein
MQALEPVALLVVPSLQTAPTRIHVDGGCNEFVPMSASRPGASWTGAVGYFAYSRNFLIEFSSAFLTASNPDPLTTIEENDVPFSVPSYTALRDFLSQMMTLNDA